MNAIPSKKLNIMLILEILRKYSDQDHRLSQQKIAELVEQEYSMKIDRKAVKRNLMNLVDMGYEIEYSENARKNKDGEEDTVYTDFYLDRDITDAELRLLIESLLFSKYIPYSQCKELIEKLKGLSSKYFGESMKYIRAMPENHSENKQLMLTIEILDEAISNGKKVAFHYTEYRTDKRRHIKRNEDGVREYKVSPYRMAIANARYFLICSHDTKGLFHYRLDGIADIRLLDEPSRPMKDVKGHESDMDLSRYMAEHIHMFSGESTRVTFRAKTTMTGAIFDWFGIDSVRISDETKDEMTVCVNVNEQDMLYWALQYGKYVEVLSPEGLRSAVRDAGGNLWKKYGGMG